MIVKHRVFQSPVLSILICHIPERRDNLKRLLSILNCQMKPEYGVEIILENTECGKITTGEKRNILLNASNGKYVAFIDDDDMVSTDYIQRILKAAKFTKDCIGIVGIIQRPNWPNWTFRHSITVTRWCKDKKNKIYFRTPNHLNPIRREIAIGIGFPKVTVSEDRDYSNRIQPYISSETFIEEPIYYYIVK